MSDRVRAAGAIVVNLAGEQPDVLLLEQVRKSGARETVAPKGGVDPGETLLDAALRETMEETGLTLLEHVGYLGQQAYHVVKDGAAVAKTVDWYLVTTDQRDVTPEEREGFVGFRWVPLAEAPALVSHPESFLPFLRRAAEMVTSRIR